jgi:hypothetical protein
MTEQTRQMHQNLINLTAFKSSHKFENMWPKSKGFVEKVKQWWMSYSFQGSPSLTLARKLKALKLGLKKWNEEVFGNVGKHKKVLLDELQVLDVIAEE